MKVNRDQITGAVLAIIGVLIFITISKFEVPFTAAYPGPKALPGLAAFGFVVCGLGIVAEGIKNRDKEQKVFLVKEGWIRLAVSMVLLCAYVLAMKYVGYIISTPIILYIFCTYYAKGYKTTLVSRIIFSIAFAAIVYVIYVFAFGLGLPAGLLFE